MDTIVKFAPFESFIDAGFWTNLTQLKLKKWKLDNSPKKCIASFVNHDPPGIPCRLSIDYHAFDDKIQLTETAVKIIGSTILTNTIEEFRDFDRKMLANKMAEEIWSEIVSKNWMHNCSTLNRFIFTVFANLKKYHFYYWLCTPAFCFPKNLRISSDPERVTDLEINDEFDEYCKENAFLMIKNSDGNAQFKSMAYLNDENFDSEKVTLIFSDPSTHEMHPGWPLRNILAAIAYQKKSWNSLKIIGLRRRFLHEKLDISHSIRFRIEWEIPSEMSSECPIVLGWERNCQGKLAPSFVDMSSNMNPIRIAENAIDLNLQLMRWRLLPELNLDKMKNLRCLLFGAGTIGCNVARCLLGWGVRNITLVDNATVSASNPVRQSLFSFRDALSDGNSKAKTAAESLRGIFPAVNSLGLNITVPMPGHPSSVSGKSVNISYYGTVFIEKTQVKNTLHQIERLISKNDAIFLLTDTRESRWLPTLLASINGKLTLSVALGFDSYVIIRHGMSQGMTTVPFNIGQTSTVSGEQLGCYFCCDVTAPGNSVRDRTLDQQCTVTRPGLAQIASGLAVELLATLVQHPKWGKAPASLTLDIDEDDQEGILGCTPHQIRGHLSRFTQLTPCVPRFDKCTACGQAVKKAYLENGWTFIDQVLDSPKYLEKLTGLEELHKTADSLDLWEYEDNESVTSVDFTPVSEA